MLKSSTLWWWSLRITQKTYYIEGKAKWKKKKISKRNILTSYHLNYLNRVLVSGLSKPCDNENSQRRKLPYKDGKINCKNKWIHEN